jgi:ABC-2 type transport system ATP-binding protein
MAHSPMSNAAITLEGVIKKYGSVEAVRGLSVSVGQGEMFGLIGPDGAGKTTTIRLMCGLLKPDGGSVRVLGRDPAKDHRERRTRLLDLTQLTPFRARLADELSGGMKQKLALACTLVHEPKVILLDEPTTGVDPVSRREFWKLLSEFLSHGITILMATPYLDEAERCARVAFLHEGRLLALDTPAALRAGLQGEVMEVVSDDHERTTGVLEQLPGAVDVQLFGERVHVRFEPGAALTNPDRLREALAQAGIHTESVRRVPTSLEDVFIARLTQHAA